MSTSFTCDWCGQLIVSKYGAVTVSFTGNYEDGWLVSRQHPNRHFHVGASGDDESCLLLALDAWESAERPKSAREQRAEAEDAWNRLARERREVLLLQALGDERLIIRELVERMNAELGFPQQKGEYRIRALYGPEVTGLVRRMWRQGQLEREAETFNVNHTRYRYSRRRGLEGPIADLERALCDVPVSDEGVA